MDTDYTDNIKHQEIGLLKTPHGGAPNVQALGVMWSLFRKRINEFIFSIKGSNIAFSDLFVLLLYLCHS